MVGGIGNTKYLSEEIQSDHSLPLPATMMGCLGNELVTLVIYTLGPTNTQIHRSANTKLHKYIVFDGWSRK